MRDWNLDAADGDSSGSGGFDLTYEGLKPNNTTRVLLPAWVLILPMRDWNQIAKLYAVLQCLIVLILPMRDWNSPYFSFHQSGISGFDLTYEGLKLLGGLLAAIGPVLFWSYLWGIETHKRGNQESKKRWAFWSYLWGIEIMARSPWRTLRILVLILPMRDWNSDKITPPILPPTSFWSYLWGIEMSLEIRFWFGKLRFWSYLWGIEIISPFQYYPSS